MSDDGQEARVPIHDEPTTELARVGPRSTPRFVWALTALYGVLLAASSVMAPLFVAADEYAHVDLTLALADGARYPEFDGRRTANAIRRTVPRYLVSPRHPDMRRSDAPPRSRRFDVHALGGTADSIDGSYNQQPQHPPLYYQLMAVVVRVERLLVPGKSPPALVTEVAILRLANAGLLLIVPWAAWAAATRLGADRHTALTAAALAMLVPQMTHVGSTVNNDNLLVALGALLAALLAGVARGDCRRRTLVLIALVTGAALLTKAFAFMLLPWIAVTFLVAARRRQRAGANPMPTVLAGLATGAGAALVSAWWWVGNKVREGTFSPSLESTLLPASPGFEPDAGVFVRRFGPLFVERFWGSFGLYSSRLPIGVIVVTTIVLAALLVAGVAVPGGRVRRVDTAVLLVPAAAIFTFVAQHAWKLHVRTGGYPFIQGRYLFAAMVPIALVAAAGARTLVRRWAPFAALAAVVVIHLVAFTTMLTDFWSGPGAGPFEELRAMVAWSAWTGGLIATGTAVGALVGGAALGVAVYEALVDRRAVSCEPQTAVRRPDRRRSRSAGGRRVGTTSAARRILGRLRLDR